MTVIGYARVATRKLSVDEREIALTAAGAERLYVDHGESRNKASLPQFSACLDYLRAGDLLLVCQLGQLDRLGRDDRLIALLHELGARGIGLRSLAEPAIDTTGPSGRPFSTSSPFSLSYVLSRSRCTGVMAPHQLERTGERAGAPRR